jgi:hypothetical protein
MSIEKKFLQGMTPVFFLGTLPAMSTPLHTTNFLSWADAVAAGKPATIAALYDDAFSLLPTLSENVISDTAGAIAYFTFFCGFKPVAKMVREFVEPMGADAYTHAGVYRFTLGPPEKREDVDARFSMAWRKNAQGVWKIVHHHSSRVPKL